MVIFHSYVSLPEGDFPVRKVLKLPDGRFFNSILRDFDSRIYPKTRQQKPQIDGFTVRNMRNSPMKIL